MKVIARSSRGNHNEALLKRVSKNNQAVQEILSLYIRSDSRKGLELEDSCYVAIYLGGGDWPTHNKPSSTYLLYAFNLPWILIVRRHKTNHGFQQLFVTGTPEEIDRWLARRASRIKYDRDMVEMKREVELPRLCAALVAKELVGA